MQTITNAKLPCANDEEIQYAYEDIVKEANKYNHWGNKPDIPLVPMHTYRGDVPSIRRLSYRMLQKFKCSYDDENQPVIMRGAWEIMINKYSSRKAFNDEVRERFLRFYKATILSYEDADKWRKKIDSLMHKEKYKRRFYRQTNTEGMYTNPRYLYSNIDCNFFIFGIGYHFIEKEKIQVVKSIYRHIKRLTVLTNPHQEKTKWQQLIQQAI